MNLELSKEQYSIVVYPHKEIIGKVKAIKDVLADKVGCYASRNSEAHITIVEFEANPNEFVFYKLYVLDFCYSQKAQNVSFNNLVTSNGTKAIVLLPSIGSKLYMRDLLRNFRIGLKSMDVVNGSGAHISIGRKLTPNQIKDANNIFEEISLDFVCEKIAVRKFNPLRRQFEVIYQFYFLGNPPKKGQLSLFG
ncbi:hypothetical protein ACFOG5_07250 [Pedobacter fastidiosus]|uniref:2'-5' RNA ligase superfamily protein n=1 Tax=Pedobacter fastidiosus TaxID=2765361 RepID=A0ABR7KVT1_9SPHI|nr:hypothetical protein [Pedobacter fastidiosus]MBC6112141.1 hypothetical protein [Pedobacter fastidiosus]